MKTKLLLLIGICVMSCQQHGKPWRQHAQPIPGRLEFEFYDEGGEGIAYHDHDSINNGSGKLNPVNGDPKNEFRIKEGVDISYTKGNGIDENPYNQTALQLNSLYVGWTEPGEWINYTIDVKEAGLYTTSLLYTANGDGVISFSVDGKPATESIRVPSTHDDRDTVAWRQWHHWNKLDVTPAIQLAKGLHTLTLHVIAHGNMNFDHLEFFRQ